MSIFLNISIESVFLWRGEKPQLVVNEKNKNYEQIFGNSITFLNNEVHNSFEHK